MKSNLTWIFILLLLFSCNEKKEAETTSGEVSSSEARLQGVTKEGDEILPMSEAEDVRNSILAFAKGDMDGMVANYDDKARLIWSNRDSIAGKKAIQDFYKARWKVIDSIIYADQVIIPVRTTVQQSPYMPSGKWVFVWSLTHARYKNGKKLVFWVHTAHHINDAGKIDLVSQYMDWAPVKEVTKDLN